MECRPSSSKPAWPRLWLLVAGAIGLIPLNREALVAREVRTRDQ
jgi:hypothetical protein